MISKLNLLKPVAVCLTLASCGNSTQDTSATLPPEFPLTDDPAADREANTWDDQNCILGAKLGQKLTDVELTSWESAPEGKRIAAISEVTSEGRTNSQDLGSITVGEVYTRKCVSVDSKNTCRDAKGFELGWVPKSPGVVPRFCRRSAATEPYSRNSNERVTLHTIVAFVEARQFINRTILKNSPIKTLDLKILPEFETLSPPNTSLSETTGKRSLMVQNLAYFPTYNTKDTPFIAVFPRKKGDDENKPRIWESQFAIAHELGHHVERVLAVDHFADASRTVVRRAVSEAYADLVGLSSLNLDDKSIMNMPCMKNRSPRNEKFDDGVDKVVDNALIVSLKTAYPTKTRSFKHQNTALLELLIAGCGSPSRLTPHDLGAILAFSFFDIMSNTLNAIGSIEEGSSVAFALSATEWLRQIDTEIGKGEAIEEDIRAVAKSIESVSQDFFSSRGQKLTRNIAVVLCQRMSLRFAGLNESKWFGLKANVCTE